jgi:hypothetical protein
MNRDEQPFASAKKDCDEENEDGESREHKMLHRKMSQEACEGS